MPCGTLTTPPSPTDVRRADLPAHAGRHAADEQDGPQAAGRRRGRVLPASVAADLVFLGLQLAGKLPAMLNWTTGPAILTRRRQALAPPRGDLPQTRGSAGNRHRRGRVRVSGRLAAAIGKLEALGTLARPSSARAVAARNCLRPEPDDAGRGAVHVRLGKHAQGRAAEPQQSVEQHSCRLEGLSSDRDDGMLGFLPPFHSFGLMGNVLAPVIWPGFAWCTIPIRPTRRTGADRLPRYQPTLLVTTPTFLSYMLRVRAADDLRSLRVIWHGGGKVPGNGLCPRPATGCPRPRSWKATGSPSARRWWLATGPDASGRARSARRWTGVEVCVVDPGVPSAAAGDVAGLLWSAARRVFRGYLNYDGPDPFVDVAGHRWYVTGDLVQRGRRGVPPLRGRLKRFLKVGGEMVSLPALEEPFQDRYPPTEAGPQVAVEGVETPGRPPDRAVQRQSNRLREANAVLAEAGFRGVMRLDEVVRVDAFPVLGTGKTDYKVLRGLLMSMANASSIHAPSPLGNAVKDLRKSRSLRAFAIMPIRMRTGLRVGFPTWSGIDGVTSTAESEVLTR